MVQFTVERTIDIPVEKAWEALADYSNVHKVHPAVGSVDQKTTNDRGLGAERTCHLYNGMDVSERITAWSDADRKYTLMLTEGKLPLKRVVATLQAVAAGEGKTKMTGEFDVVAKYGPIGKLMEILFIKRNFVKGIGNVFAGIEHYVKTGKEVDQGFSAATPALVRKPT